MNRNVMEFKHDWFDIARCPGCGWKIIFRYKTDCILVNNWSKRFVDVPGMYVLDRECSNPNCEHSKIEMIRSR